jgi:hypothetical protein
MIVIVAGMQRSGSTFLFNIVREILLQRGDVENYASNALPAQARNVDCFKNIIIKTHDPDDELTKMILAGELPCVCTFRKPEDAITSWIRVFGFSMDESIEAYRSWLKWHKVVREHVLNIRYEEIDKFPFLSILKISRYLVGKFNFFEAMRIWWFYRKKMVYKKVKKIKRTQDGVVDIGFSFYDSETFFHRNHVSSLTSVAGIDELSPKQISHIRDSLHEFVDKDGNYFVRNE